MENLKSLPDVPGMTFDWTDFVTMWLSLYGGKPVTIDDLLDIWITSPNGAYFLGGNSLHGRKTCLGRILKANAGADRGYSYRAAGGHKTVYFLIVDDDKA